MRMTSLVMAMAAVACAGCTMNALRRETLAQVDSSVDLRYRQAMDNLALIADDPTALPVYASIYAGTSTITDTGSIGETTIWQRAKGMNGFGSEALNPSVSRQIGQNWTVDPIVDPERLEVVRWACRWVVYGPQSVSPEGISLLARPDQVPNAAGRHFGVLDQMNRLPNGWLGIGGANKAPRQAVYKACHGGTSVWVLPEGVRGLADLSLVLQNISRVDINSTTLFNPGLVGPATWQFNVEPVAPKDPNRPKVKVSVSVNVDYQGKLAPDAPYIPYRLDSLGTDPTFRTTIVAAAAVH